MLRHVACSSTRLYSTTAPKLPVELIRELRKLTDVSLSKAREALAASNNDINRALEWVQKDLVTSGLAQAAKVDRRKTREGVVSTAILSSGRLLRRELGHGGIRAAMVELNCETDFVGRNELFGRLAADIAHTAAFITEPSSSKEVFQECPLDLLNDAPLISEQQPNPRATATVGSSIRDLIAKVGEKVSLQRAVTVVRESPSAQNDLDLRLATYNHGSITIPNQGQIGTLAVLALKSPKIASLLASETFQIELGRLQRALGRQITGFETTCVISPTGEELATSLYDQPFVMLPSNSSSAKVQEVLKTWALEQGLTDLSVLDFIKWRVGEIAERP